MALEQVLTRLEDLSLPTQIRESDWMFPTIETVHVFALVLVVGSIMTVDLRLLGLANKERPFSQVASEMLPWTWTAFHCGARRDADVFIQGAHLLRQHSISIENGLLAVGRHQYGDVSLVGHTSP